MILKHLALSFETQIPAQTQLTHFQSYSFARHSTYVPENGPSSLWQGGDLLPKISCKTSKPNPREEKAAIVHTGERVVIKKFL